MRHIHKRQEPTQFRKWKRDNADFSPSFKTIEPKAKKALQQQLAKEQGHLCGYTMWPLDGFVSSHVEHIRPQRRHPDLALAYENMLLCVSGPGHKKYPFGANAKEDIDVTEDDFVSPLLLNCERRFKFQRSGEIISAQRNDSAAKNTIELLKLNHPVLVSARRQVIALQLYGRDGKRPLPPSQARRLAASVVVAEDHERLTPFCIAVQQAALEFATQREKLSRRLASRLDR